MQQQLMTIRENGVQTLLIRRLNELKKESSYEIIPFNLVFHRLCSWFSIKKQECWELLHFLQDAEMIEILSFRGIKINL